MFVLINYKVIRIRAKYILAHGTEINVPHWEIQTSRQQDLASKAYY